MVVISQICGLEAEKAMNVSKTGQPTQQDPVFSDRVFSLLVNKPQDGLAVSRAGRVKEFSQANCFAAPGGIEAVRQGRRPWDGSSPAALYSYPPAALLRA